MWYWLRSIIRRRHERKAGRRSHLLKHSRYASRPVRASRLLLQALEERTVPTVSVFNSSNQFVQNFSGTDAIQQAVNSYGANHTYIAYDDEIYSDFSLATAGNLSIIGRDVNTSYATFQFQSDGNVSALGSAYSDGMPGGNLNLPIIQASGTGTTVTVRSGANEIIDGLVIRDGFEFNPVGVEVTGGTGFTTPSEIINSYVLSHDRGIVIDAGASGFQLADSTVSLNTQEGIRFNGGTTTQNVSINNDFITGNVTSGTPTFAGVRFAPTYTGNNVNIYYDDLSGNGGSGAVLDQSLIANSAGKSGDVNFSFDWWGAASGPSGATIGGIAAPGTGAKVSNRVDVTPYLVSGDADANPNDGFQPSLGVLNVTNYDVQTGGIGRIQEAITGDPGTTVGVNPAGIINVSAGTFQEADTVPKAVSLRGANFGMAGSGSRGAETVVIPNGNQNALFLVTANNVTIDGFTINGDDPNTTGGTLFSGADANASYGVSNVLGTPTSGTTTNISGLTVENDIIKNVGIGVLGQNPTTTTPASTGSLITGNWFDSIGNFDFGYAVSLRKNFYADITNNLMTRVWSGVHTNDFHLAGGPATWTVSGNTIHSYAGGLLYWLQYGSATPMTFTNNQISAETGAVAGNYGVLMVSIQGTDGITFTHNTITGTAYGIGLTNVSTSNVITLGATNSISGTTSAGVYLTDNLTVNSIGTTDLTSNGYTGPGNAIAVNVSGMPISIASGDGVKVETSRSSNDVNTTATITGSTISDVAVTTIGIDIEGALATASVSSTTITGLVTGIEDNGGTLTVGSGDSITGGTTGMLVNGATAAITGDTLGDLSFSGQSGSYISLTGGALNGQELNATGASFDGFIGAGGSLPADLATYYAKEDKIDDYLDAPGVGFVRLKSGNVFVTQLSESTTAGAIQRGIDAATAGDTEQIQAGTYTLASDIGIDKQITLLGPNGAISPNTGSRVPEAIIDGGGNFQVRVSTTDPVTFQGLMFSATNLDSYTTGNQVTFAKDIIADLPGNMFYANSASFVLTDNDIYGTADGWDAVLLAGDWNGATGTAVTIQDNVIGDASPNGGSGLNLSSVQGTILGNTFQNISYYGLLLANDTNVSVANNQFSGIVNPDPTGVPTWGAGIRTYTPTANFGATITGNSFTNDYVGIGVRLGSDITGLPFTISDNTFTGNTYDIIDQGTSTSTVTPGGDNVFDGVTLSAATLSDLYKIEDKIVDAVDVSGYGLVRLKANNVYVTPSSFFAAGGTTTPSIQRGVDAATAGDTVNVEAGTYGAPAPGGDTALNIDKGVIVQATDGAANTIIDGNSATDNYYVVIISASNVTLSGFTITNAAYDGTADASGVLIESPTTAHLLNTRVTGNIIHDIGMAGRANAYATMGINVEEGNDGLEIDHNTIYNIDTTDGNFAIGILTAGDTGQEVDTANIHDNTIYDIANPNLAAAIDAGSSSQNVTIQNNTIGLNGNSPGPVGYGIRTGSGASGTITISSNIVENASVAGIDLNSPFAETVHLNTVSGSAVGLEIESGAVLTAATNNLFAGNGIGVLVDSGAASVGPITSSAFEGNTTAGLENDSALNVAADHNWWNSVNGPTNPSNPVNVGNQGDAVIDTSTGVTNFTPWLSDGTNLATGPGFVPASNTTFAPVTNDLGDGFLTIQLAVDGTPSGHTIFVSAGTYGENVNVYKTLTIEGTNDAFDPNSNQAPANPQAVLEPTTTGFTVTADNVVIEGFTIDGSNGSAATAISVDSADGATVTNNLIENFATSGVVFDPSSNGLLQNNLIENVGTGDDSMPAVAVLLNNAYASVLNNVLTQDDIGVEIENLSTADAGTRHAIDSNSITYAVHGMVIQDISGNATAFSITSNTITSEQLATVVNDGVDVGLMLLSIGNADGETISGNTVDGADIGVFAWNNAAALIISGGTIENAHDSLNFGQGVYASNVNFLNQTPAATNAETITLDGVALVGNDTAVQVFDYQSAGPAVSVGLTDGTTITIPNHGVGVLVDGANASIAADTLNDTAFTTASGQPYAYIQFMDGAMGGQEIDGTTASFDGFVGGTAPVATATDLAKFYAVEDLIGDALDTSGVGFVRLKDGYVFLAQSSEVNPGSLQRAVDAATADDTVFVQAGTFTGDVEITKTLTLDGAQAGVDPVGGRAGAESVITGAGITAPIAIDSGVNNVTINGFTIDSPMSGSGSDNAGIFTNGSTGVTIDYNIIQDNTTGIAIGGSAGSITDNVIQDNNVGLGVQPGAGAGVEFFAGSNGVWTVSYNYFTGNDNNDILLAAGEGPSNTIANVSVTNNQFVNSTASPVFALDADNFTFSGNTISGAAFTGVVLDGEVTNSAISGNMFTNNSAGAIYAGTYPGLGANSNLTISGNTITQDASLITSPTSMIDLEAGAGVSSMSDNTITINNLTTQQITGESFLDAGTVNVTGDQITGATTGVNVEDNQFLGTTLVTLSGVTVSATATGVQVQVDSPATCAAGVTIQGGSTIGVTASNGTAVKVIGDGASASLTDTTINLPSADGNTATGVDDEGGALTFGTGDAINNGQTGILVNGSTSGLTSLSDLTFTGQSGDYVTLTGSALSGDEINATSASFDGVGSATMPPATLSQYYGIEDKTTDVLDTPGVGFVRLETGHVFVTQNSENTTPNALQRAVGVAVADDTINVSAGTFLGQVVVDGTDLSIIGAGAGSTTIQSPPSLAVSFTTSDINKPIVFFENVDSGNISDLTIDGAGLGNANYRFIGLAYFNAGGTVDGLTIEHIRNNPLDGDQEGIGIYAYAATGGPDLLTITNNDIFDYQKNGMALSGSALTVDVENNTVTGAGPTTLNAQNGIQVGFGAGGTIAGNTVRGNSYTGDQPADGNGVLLYQTAVGTSVTGNTISGSDLGVYSNDASGPVTISGNTISGSAGAGIYAANEDAGYTGPYAISFNTLQNAVGDGGPEGNTGDGMDLFGNLDGSTIHNNLIQINTGTGVYVGSDVAGSLAVNNNSIMGNATAGLDNESGVTVDATSNWWGSANGPTDPANTYNVGSQGDSIVGPGTTTFVPWLNSGHNNPPAPPGFVPDSNVSFGPVHDTTSDTYYVSIQAAVDGASSGDTIVAAAGTFNENVDVDKSLTIMGAGSGANGTIVTAPSGAVFTIDANNVTLEDLRLTGSTSTNGVEFDTAVDPTTLDNLYITGVQYGIEIHNSSVVTGLNITDVDSVDDVVGLRESTTGSASNVTITDGHFDNDQYGLETFASNSIANNAGRFTNVSVTGTTFDNDTNKGLYFETLDNATFNGIDVTDSGTSGASAAGIDVNLKYGVYSTITFENFSITGSGTGDPVNGLGLTIKGRDDAPSYNSHPASVSGVNITDVTITGSPTDLAIGNHVTGVSLSGVSLGGSGLGLSYYGSAADTLNLADTSLAGSLAGYVFDSSANNVDGTGATYGGIAGGNTLSVTNGFAIADKIVDGVDVPGYGLVRLRAGEVYVTPNSFYSPTTTTTDVQRGVNVATAGDTVNVEAGTYSSAAVTVNKALTILGQGSGTNGTVLNGTGNVVTIAANAVTLESLRITGNGSSNGVYFNSAVDGTTLSDVVSSGHSNAIEVHNAAVVTNLTLTNVDLTNSAIGMRLATTGEVSGMTVTGGNISGNQYGLYTNADLTNSPAAALANEAGFEHVTFTDTTFAGNDAQRAMYFEKLNDVTFTNVTVTANKTGTVIDVNLKNGAYSGLHFNGGSITDAAAGTDLYIKGRNDGGNASTPGSLTGVTLSNETLSSLGTDLAFQYNVTLDGSTFSGVVLNGSGTGIGFFGADGASATDMPSQTVALNDTAFAGSLAAYVVDTTHNNVDGTAATYGGIAGGNTLTVANGYAIADKIVDGVDASSNGFNSLGLVRLRAGEVYVTPNSFYAALGTTTPDINRGVSVASTNDTVNVEAGTYTGAVNVNKTLTLLGANVGVAGSGSRGAESVMQSPANGDTPLQISASDVTVDGFTVQGNTNESVSGAGVYITPGVSGTRFMNSIVQDNIVGLDLANASSTDQAQIVDNLFRDNTNAGASSGTGIYADNFTAGGVVSDVLIEDNTFTNTSFVENSWGIGISNIGASPFTNFSVLNNNFSNAGRGMYFQDTVGATISNNVIDGATHYGIGLFGFAGMPVVPANGSFTITSNTFTDDGVGLELEDDITASPTGAAYSGSITAAAFNNNTFAASTTTYIYNASATAIDATGTGNTYGGYTPSAADLAGQFALADRIIDAIDVPTFGLVDIDPTHLNIYVTPNSFSAPDGTTVADVNRGVVAATAGDTVNVEAGSYTGDVDINKSLMLLGAQANVDPTVMGGRAGSESTITGAGVTAPISIDSGVNGVVIDGFTIQSPAGGSGSLNGGVWTNGSTGVTIDYDIIQNNTAGVVIGNSAGTISHNVIPNNNAPGASAGTGVEFFAGSNSGGWTISDNYFTGNNNNDVLVEPGEGTSNTVANVSIANNQFVNSTGGPIYVINVNNLQVSGNTISGAAFTGIVLNGEVANSAVTGNSITNGHSRAILTENSYSGYGYQPNSDVTISGNTITQDASLLTVAPVSLIDLRSGTGSITVSNNTISVSNLGSHAVTGVGLTASPGTVTLEGNTIKGAADGVSGVKTGINVGTGTTATLLGNTVHGGTGVGRIGIAVAGAAALGNDTAGGANVITGWTGANAIGVDVVSTGAATLLMNTITGNNDGVIVNAGTALLQDNDLRSNTTNGLSSAGLDVRNDAVVDAGQVNPANPVGGTNFTGLGISTGGNLFNWSSTPLGGGYSSTGAKAIVNENDFVGLPTGSAPVQAPNVPAQYNNFGTTTYGNIEQIVFHYYDSGKALVDYRNAVGATAPALEMVNGAGSVNPYLRIYAVDPLVTPNTIGLANQRSIIRAIQFQVDSPITLGAGAVDLTRLGDTSYAWYASALPTGAVPISVTSSIDGATGRTTVTIEFTTPNNGAFNGSMTEWGSLVDGNYNLGFNGAAAELLFVGSGLTAQNHTDSLFRFFGDTNGSRTLNSADTSILNQAIAAQNANMPSDLTQYFDLNQNGTLDPFEVQDNGMANNTNSEYWRRLRQGAFLPPPS